MNDTEVLQDFAWVPRELGLLQEFFHREYLIHVPVWNMVWRPVCSVIMFGTVPRDLIPPTRSPRKIRENDVTQSFELHHAGSRIKSLLCCAS